MAAGGEEEGPALPEVKQLPPWFKDIKDVRLLYNLSLQVLAQCIHMLHTNMFFSIMIIPQWLISSFSPLEGNAKVAPVLMECALPCMHQQAPPSNEAAVKMLNTRTALDETQYGAGFAEVGEDWGRAAAQIAAEGARP